MTHPRPVGVVDRKLYRNRPCQLFLPWGTLPKGLSHRRTRAMTVSRPPVFLTTQPAPLKPSTSPTRSSPVQEIISTVKEEEEEKGDEEEDLEFIEREPNMEHAVNGSPACLERSSRPSQLFQDRQNKRFSLLLMGEPHSPPAKSTASSSLSSQSSSSNPPNFYELLVSKFGRQSQDQPCSSSKQEALKQETMDSLDRLKETAGDDYDWSK